MISPIIRLTRTFGTAAVIRDGLTDLDVFLQDGDTIFVPPVGFRWMIIGLPRSP